MLISFATSDSADYSITIITPLNILVSLNVQRFKGVKVKTIRLSLFSCHLSPFILYIGPRGKGPVRGDVPTKHQGSGGHVKRLQRVASGENGIDKGHPFKSPKLRLHIDETHTLYSNMYTDRELVLSFASFAGPAANWCDSCESRFV